jgi:VCBS repeat-containing protein
MSTDHKLKEDVTAALGWEPSIAADHIGVAVEDGVVTLTGHVDSYWQKSQAERAIGRIRGVKGLAEELEVRLPGHMKKGDDEIAQAALHRMSSDIAIPKDAVKVKVQKGWVTLTGEVEWHYQKDAAAREVRSLAGVTSVTNDVTVKAHPNTAKISEDISHALHRNYFTDENVKVTATGGKVRLTGHVPSWSDRGLAFSTAWMAPGVTSVQNDISVA